MSDEWTTEQLRLFMLAHVESVEQLELLLIMAEQPDQPMTWDSAVPRVGVDRVEARAALAHLAAQGLLTNAVEERGPVYWYRPTPELRIGVEALVRARVQSPTTIMKLMSTNAVERMRTWAMRAFADAFVVVRKKDDG